MGFAIEHCLDHGERRRSRRTLRIMYIMLNHNIYEALVSYLTKAATVSGFVRRPSFAKSGS
jgi:hypothetical protein